MLGLSSGREPDPAPSKAERAVDLAHLKRGLAHAARHGITSIVNMDGNIYTLDLLEELRSAGELTARVRVPFHYVPEMKPDDLETALEMRARWSDEWLASGFVKFFMDGVIDSRTAFMKHDYPGQPGYRSHGRFSAETFAELATRIDAMGLQIAVHAIGDAAVARVLDGYAAVRAANGASGLRHRIEHLELVDNADFARIAVVTDPEWVRIGVKMFAPLIPCPVHLFHLTERAAAQDWICANGPDRPHRPGVDATHKIPPLEDRIPPES